MKRISVWSLLLVLACSVNAFELDDFAINDDDNIVSPTGSGRNYTIHGYLDSRESKNTADIKKDSVSIFHDPKQGVQEPLDNEDSGLVLKGIRQGDLEDMFYGTELLKNSTK